MIHETDKKNDSKTFIMFPKKNFLFINSSKNPGKNLQRLLFNIDNNVSCIPKQHIKMISNQIKSNHFYCHITTAQVPWWVKFLWACSRQCRKTTDNLHMDRQCKKTTTDNLHMDRQCKKTTNNLPMDRQCKKTTNNLHMDRQCKKTALEHLQCSRQCKKKTTTIYIWTDSAKKNNSNLHMDRQCKKQQQFTYGQYIFTDCTEDNVQNTHTYTQYA